MSRGSLVLLYIRREGIVLRDAVSANFLYVFFILAILLLHLILSSAALSVLLPSTEDNSFDLGRTGSIPCHRADLVENKHTDHARKLKFVSLHLSLYAGRRVLDVYCTGCPTRYRTVHFLNNSNTNEDIATEFEQEYVLCVRNEEECVCSPLQIPLQYPH